MKILLWSPLTGSLSQWSYSFIYAWKSLQLPTKRNKEIQSIFIFFKKKEKPRNSLKDWFWRKEYDDSLCRNDWEKTIKKKEKSDKEPMSSNYIKIGKKKKEKEEKGIISLLHWAWEICPTFFTTLQPSQNSTFFQKKFLYLCGSIGFGKVMCSIYISLLKDVPFLKII